MPRSPPALFCLWVAQCSAASSAQGTDGTVALLRAAKSGNLDHVELLYEACVDLDTKDQVHNLPSSRASKRPFTDISFPSQDGKAPIHLAANGGYANVVGFLAMYSETQVWVKGKVKLSSRFPPRIPFPPFRPTAPTPHKPLLPPRRTRQQLPTSRPKAATPPPSPLSSPPSPTQTRQTSS